jgi:succinate dehydrogenase / fumarate reductase, cytochrome b subunit
LIAARKLATSCGHEWKVLTVDIQQQRPLSPHLQIYKPQMTSVMSILHRATGFGLSLGLLLFTYWLWAAAYSPEHYQSVVDFAGSIFGLILLFGWSLAFYYHLAAGIRHLIWDSVRMLELENAYKAGYFVLGFTLGATGATWLLIIGGLS